MKPPYKLGQLAGVGLVALAAALGPGCSSGFERTGPRAQLSVTITQGNLGSPNGRLPIPFTPPAMYVVNVEAHKADGTLDDKFNGFVRASVKPGTVQAVGPNPNAKPGDPMPFATDGRNVQLSHGVAQNVAVYVAATYSDTRIWFDDIGYTPADITRQPPPQCSDGIDNNGNGLVDFPADPGCAFANDDTEEAGSFAGGVSQPVYFLAPRIHDVRGRDIVGNVGGNVTNFPHEQVQMDTGWREASQQPPRTAGYLFSTLVTRVAADGFYVTDLQDDLSQDPLKVPGYGSVFAYTFSSPPLMRTCDRLKVFGGTASDFHGFTEIGFPTWLLEEWDATQRPCGIYPPRAFSPSDLLNPDLLFQLESSLVRMETNLGPNKDGTAPSWTIHIASNFGPGLVPLAADGVTYVPSRDASNCDFNHNGKVDFIGGAENVCSCYCDGCTSDPRNPNANPPTPIAGDPECSEYSGFTAQNEFKLVVTYNFNAVNPPQLSKIQVNGSSSPAFDPLGLKRAAAPGVAQLRSFTGTLRYFSGGSQFTVEARCDDDIIVKATDRPFCSDADYDAQDPTCPTLDGTPLPTNGPVPPPNRRLACVHARSISDINESSH